MEGKKFEGPYIEEEKPVQDLVLAEEKKVEKEPYLKNEVGKFPIILLGALIYAIGVNIFLKPLHLYSGGFMGFAQLIETVIKEILKIHVPFNLSGIFYYLFNIPGLIIAWKNVRKRFVVKSLLAVTAITVLVSVIPIPAEPVLHDTLSNAMISGIICGAGIGMILLMGACDGGMTLVSMLILQLKGTGSVGRLGLYVNIVLYSICLFLFDIPTVIYSLIYSVFNSMITDRIHTQNINVQMLSINESTIPPRKHIPSADRQSSGLQHQKAILLALWVSPVRKGLEMPDLHDVIALFLLLEINPPDIFILKALGEVIPAQRMPLCHILCGHRVRGPPNELTVRPLFPIILRVPGASGEASVPKLQKTVLPVLRHISVLYIMKCVKYQHQIFVIASKHSLSSPVIRCRLIAGRAFPHCTTGQFSSQGIMAAFPAQSSVRAPNHSF